MAGNRAIEYKELRDLYTLKGPEKTCQWLRESMARGDLSPKDFSIRELFESTVEDGHAIAESFCPTRKSSHVLMEANAAAVETAHFSNIFGQIAYTATLAAYQSEEFMFTKLIPVEPTRFNGQRIAGISRIGDEAEVVDEGQPYPIVGVSEDYIDTPSTKKRGLEVDVTKEAIFFDNTGLLLTRCAEVGEFLGLNLEKRAIDCIIDENGGAVAITQGGHRYHWRGTSYASYQTSTPWDNVTGSAGMVDWTDFDESEQTLASILDPFTGEPITTTPTDVICARQNLWTARRVVNATEITVVSPGYATSGNPTETKTSNPVGSATIYSSQLLAARMATDTTWYRGSVAKYAKYMQNWPLHVIQSDENSEVGFTRDIVKRYRADERGAFVVVDPRTMTKITA